MSIPVQPAAVTEAEQAAPPSQSFAALQARTQRFTLGTPREFRVSPRGDRVLFLRSPSATEAPHALYSMDTATGTERRLVDPATLGVDEQDVPAEERARRERSRTQGGGVMGYACDVEFTVAAFMLAGRLYGLDLHTAQVSELAASRPVIDPRPDPTGRRVAYVCGGAVHLLDLTSGQDSVLAARAEDESEDVEWGLAEFVAAE
ncbi:MAG: hypothetical protein ACRDRL_18565, partial [Sciscionella sp.]